MEKNYHIKNFTYTPSVYGRNNLIFEKKDDVLIEKEENHYKIISQQIEYKTSGSKPVAVFVVFETIKHLNTFYNSEEFISLKNGTRCLTEEANQNERKILISNSTLSGKITLFTRSYGRGTDFIVYDENVIKNGGVHVIQTFLSEEYSEEVQIKGRTARQGRSGTYQLILSIKALEKFQIFPEDIEKKPLSERYDFIDGKRQNFFKIKYNESVNFVDLIKDKHEKTVKFLNCLFEALQNFNSIREFLLEENKSLGGHPSFKTLILLDATGSMCHLLDKTKKKIEVMFERITNVLEHDEVKDKSFQIKIAVFRNYNLPEDKIYEESTWESKPQNLKNFLDLVDCEGGWENEAIEIGFFNANQMKGLSQIILIGDAPPNTNSEIKSKRNAPSYRNVWKKSERYNQPTNFMKELEILKKNGVVVHAFYVMDRAKVDFEKIAHLTDGNCKFLNINSQGGSEDLLNLVNVEILKNMGGDGLVRSYKRIYHLS